MIPTDALADAERLILALKTRRLKLTTAESCTGGLLAAVLTEVPGASEVFERGFVTYSNSSKIGLLDVAPELIRAHGAVSAEVAAAMALGALRGSGADLAVAVTGIAGPSGGSEAKPVGLVYIAFAGRGAAAVTAERRYRDLGRAGVRCAAVSEALALIRGAVAGVRVARDRSAGDKSDG